MKTAMKRVVFALGILGLLTGLAAWALSAWIDLRLDEPFVRDHGGAVDVEIESGMAAGEVARRLATAGVVAEASDLVWWLWWTELAGDVQAGEYRFEAPFSVRQVADVITQGRVRLYPVTLPEGSTRWQAATAIAAAGFGDEGAALAATERVELIADLDPEADTLEGYLFPETYMVPAATSPAEIVELMVRDFRAAWTPDLAARAEVLGFSLRDVVILAS